MGLYYRNGESNMKEVISGNKLREKMIEAVDLICESVGSTLGPSGNNVLSHIEKVAFENNLAKRKTYQKR